MQLSPVGKGCHPSFEKKILNHLHLSMLCAKFGWKWPSGSGEEDFKSCQFIFIISQLSPLWGGRDPSFEQTWIPFTQEFRWKWARVTEEKDFLKLSIYFNYLPIISPLRRVCPFIWTNFYPGILCAKFGWNRPCGSGEDENVKSLQTDKQTDPQTDRRRTTGDQKS